jgi:hypothetical protein
LKFSTLTNCNDWTDKHRDVSYLDSLECKRVVLFNEMVGQLYRGSVIKRYDKIINTIADQSYKAHVNGEIIKSWNRTSCAKSAQQNIKVHHTTQLCRAEYRPKFAKRKLRHSWNVVVKGLWQQLHRRAGG